jgi:hypothetical protein
MVSHWAPAADPVSLEQGGSILSDRRSLGLLVWLRTAEVVVVALMVWAEIELRTWVPDGFPDKALGLAASATCLSGMCLIVRWQLGSRSHASRLEATVLGLLTLLYPLRLLLCCAL